MSDADLTAFADQVLSIVIPPETKRSKILSMIVNAAQAAPDAVPPLEVLVCDG